MTTENSLDIVEKICANGSANGICNCPYSEIEYLIDVNENLEAVNLKTGKCLRCNGTRLSKFDKKVLRSRRKLR